MTVSEHIGQHHSEIRRIFITYLQNQLRIY